MRARAFAGVGTLITLALVASACTDGQPGGTERGAGGLSPNVAVSVPHPGQAAESTLTAPEGPTAPAATVAPPATAVPSPSSAAPSRRAATTARPTATPARSNTTLPPKTTVPAGKASGVDVLPGTHCQVFPTDNYWHADIRSLPVNAHSAQWLAAMGAATRKLHPDFGPSGDPSAPYGIPVTIAKAGHPKVTVDFDYADESDRVGYPLGSDTSIEGGADADGDRHAIVVTADSCDLFETYDTRQSASGWTAGSGAHWSLSSDALRPDGWTSADAAGLPILPGLLRFDEVASGHVDHAIRFTTDLTDSSHLWPARHDASTRDDPSLPPMGARFRLKAGFDISKYSAQTQVVLKAMQTYGLVLADNGSPWFFQGTADNAWPDALISQLKTIPASAFEAVDTISLQMSANSAAAR